MRGEAQPKTIPNPLYCEKCEGRGYLVADAEWEPIAVQCDACKDGIKDYVPTYIDGLETAIRIVEASMNDGSSGEDIREICDARLVVVKSRLIDEISHADLRASGGIQNSP